MLPLGSPSKQRKMCQLIFNEIKQEKRGKLTSSDSRIASLKSLSSAGSAGTKLADGLAS